jgi:type VI protein secretion system component Hcp
MRRGIWVGAAVLIAVAAAIPLWLVLDDGGERRAAALTEAPGKGLGRLTIPGVNDGQPFAVDSFSWGAERQANGVQFHDLEFTREVSEISPQLFDLAAPSAKLQLFATDPSQGNIVVWLTYEFTDIAIHVYRDAGGFGGADLTKSGATPQPGRTTARMTFASVNERFAFTLPAPPASVGRMAVSTAEGRPVAIRAYQFGFEKRPSGDVSADRLIVTREIDSLAPWLSAAVIRGTPAGTSVTIELIRTSNEGSPETYAVYDLRDVTVESVRDFDDSDAPSSAVDTLALQEVTLSFGGMRMTSGGAAANLAPSP